MTTTRIRTENFSSSGRSCMLGSTGAPFPSSGRAAAMAARSRVAKVPDTGAVSPVPTAAVLQWSVAG